MTNEWENLYDGEELDEFHESFCFKLSRNYEYRVQWRKKTPIKRWIIRRPGSGSLVECVSFEEAMDKWFEGFNIPHLEIDGNAEKFETAYARVEGYFKRGRGK